MLPLNYLKHSLHFIFGFSLAFFSGITPANPTSGKVVHGQAVISNPDSLNTIINQRSQKLISNWQSFSIARPETTTFIQPSSSAIALNRVIGGDPSKILGSLNANGQVFISNPSGVLFGKNAQVNVHGLLATTLNISDEDFMRGNYQFSQEVNQPNAVVINNGSINASSYVAFLGNAVQNNGVINAKMGSVVLASGSAATLDFVGDGLISFAVTEATRGEVYDLEGHGVKDRILNTGQIRANGGQVQLTVMSANDVVRSVINNEGIIEANTVVEKDGRIFLGGGDNGIVSNSGTIAARGDDAGETGGKIVVTGETVELQNALVDASGETGGGEIYIGGGWQGKDQNIANAKNTTVDKHSRIIADAKNNGDGGTVVVWADDSTESHGNISVTGGSESGDGGNAEVSGKEHLLITGHADLSAAKGDFGTVLLDPGSVSIQDGANTNAGFDSFNDLWIINQLAGGNLAINTSAASAGNETITVAGDTDITWSQATTLELNAGRNIVMNSGAVIANTSATTGFDALILNANQGTPTSGTFVGVELDNTQISSVGGNITINGRGGKSGANNSGIYQHNGTQLTTTDGAISLTGVSSGTTTNNYGIYLQGTGLATTALLGTKIISNGSGTITLNGTGGFGQAGVTSGSNYGIYLANAAQVLSRGTGTTVITGKGGNADFFSLVRNNNSGVFINGMGTSTTADIATRVEAASADITVNGTGGTSGGMLFVGDNNHGVVISNSGQVRHSGTGDINIIGTSGGLGMHNLNDGVLISSASHVLHDGAGDINISGFSNSGIAANRGVHINGEGSSVATRVEATGGGDITIMGLPLGNTGNATNPGVRIFDAAQVLNSGTGNISITGKANTGFSNSPGVEISGASTEALAAGRPMTKVEANGGDIIIDGTGGRPGVISLSAGLDNFGVHIFNAAQILNSGAGGIDITGLSFINFIVGFEQDNHGVFIEGVGTTTTASRVTKVEVSGMGDISINGTGANFDASDNVGVLLTEAAQVINSGTGNIDVTGSGGGVDSGNHGVSVEGMGAATTATIVTKIEANGGDLTINGTASNIGNASSFSGTNNSGVHLSNAARVMANGAGNINITGFNPSIFNSFENGYGTYITGGAQVLHSGTGDINITGTSSAIATIGNGYGIFLEGTDTRVTASGGDITINGTGGLGVGNNNYGVYLTSGAQVLNSVAGGITVIGTGGPGGDNNHGVFLEGAGTQISTANGEIVIAAERGAGTNSKDFNNTVGTTALDAGIGRWLVYSSDPSNDTFGGLVSGNQALWNKTFAGNPPASITETGNRYLFSTSQTLTFTSTDATKTYGDVPDLSSNFTTSGFVNAGLYGNVFTQDGASNTFMGNPAITSTGAVATVNVTALAYSIDIADGTQTSTTGYDFAFNSAGKLMVNPRAITLTADPNQDKTVGQLDPALTFSLTSGTLVIGDAFTGSLLRDPGETIGAYAIHQGSVTVNDGNGGNNYAVTYQGDNFTISVDNFTISSGGSISGNRPVTSIGANFNILNTNLLRLIPDAVDDFFYPWQELALYQLAIPVVNIPEEL